MELLNREFPAINIYSLLFYFVLYSFLGLIVEGLYSLVMCGSFSKNGFLIGPFKPMYGFAMTIIIVLQRYNSSLWFLGIMSIIVPSTVEYISGFLLDHLLGLKYWDYADLPLNINGYVCLLFSAFWIILVFAAIYILQPIINNIYMRSIYISNSISIILTIYLLVDLVLTLVAKMPKDKFI